MKAKSSLTLALLLGVAMFSAAYNADAQQIIAPTSGVINSSGPGFGTLTETFDQTGLFSGYVSGVTNFDAYLGTGPRHNEVFFGNEWFSNENTTSASVTYSLGSIISIDRLALWNEESSGIGILDLYSSTDGVTFTALALGLLPTDNPLTLPSSVGYLADVFSFSGANAQFVRFDMSNCPQPVPGAFASCAIGEVAFRVAAIPEPEIYVMLAAGLGMMGFVARRRKQQLAAA